jgi:hypothetical protein
METAAVQNFRSRKKIGTFTVDDSSEKKSSNVSSAEKDSYKNSPGMAKIFEIKGGSIENSPREPGMGDEEKTTIKVKNPEMTTIPYLEK